MKIGIDCRLWDETGVGRYIRNLVLNLQKVDRKNEYVLFALSKDEKNIKTLIHDSRFMIRFADIKWHTLEEQLKFPQILNKENLDLMHFPYFSVPIFYNRPFVVTIHDLIMHHFLTGQASTLSPLLYKLKLLGYKYVVKKAAQKARKIIAVSNATKDEIIDHLRINPGKVVVTYEGVDDKISNFPASPRLRGASKIQKYFLYVGNAYPHKNLERFLETFSSLTSHFSFLNLVLVGKEDYFYKRLRKKVEELNLSDRVIFLQNVSDGQLQNLYKNAIVLIMPSLMEGFGLPALEAMANSCLVLASDIPALHEVCKDAAVYFNPYDKKDIAEKINAVHSNDTYHYSVNREKGLERVKFFSWRKMAKETLKIYESCVGI